MPIREGAVCHGWPIHFWNTGSNNVVIGTDASTALWTVVISGTNQEEKISFSLTIVNSTFIRKVFNTNPQLVSGVYIL